MAGLTGRSVMVVEDSFYLAMDVARTLEDAGARVLGPYSDGQEALRSLGDETPDCAVLDVNLGEGPGFSLARAMQDRAIPFVFFTGYDESAIPAELAHVVRLEKPVQGPHLLRAVERELTR
jgi:CheY-like chemotaxis protein